MADEEAPPLIGISSEQQKRESDSFVGEEEREWLLRRQEQPGWRVDHGEGAVSIPSTGPHAH